MSGALAGALVAAFAAWLSSRAIQSRQEVHAYEMRLDAAILKFTDELRSVIDEMESVRLLNIRSRRRRARMWIETVDRAALRLMSAVDPIFIIANQADAPTIRALQTRVLEWERVRDGGWQIIQRHEEFVVTALDTLRVLGMWRRKQIDRLEAKRLLHRDTSPVPDSPSQVRRELIRRRKQQPVA